jgi:hypothetical protein
MPGPLRPLSLALSDVCFVHWPVPEEEVRAFIPDWTDPDTADGTAWVTAIALTIDRFDTFGIPMREDVDVVVVRTYVTLPSRDRAIHFASVNVDDRLVADAARTIFRVPAHHADVRRHRDATRTEVVARRHDDTRQALAVTLDPTGDPTPTTPDTLASFLVDRERYVATGPLDTRLVGSVGHPPWAVQPATATVTDRTLLAAAGIDGHDDPALAHYSPGLDMTIGTLEPT